MAAQTPFETRALELITESAQHGGFWALIADDTLNIIVQAVALDLQRSAHRAAILDSPVEADRTAPPRHRNVG